MGIFSDICSKCGSKVKKAARFCSKCGDQAPKGWFKCPACGKWAGSESEYCWNCKTPLNPKNRGAIAGGKWLKPAGVFAQRFEVGSVLNLLKNGLKIHEGVCAVVVDNGRFRDVLGPGSHTMDSTVGKLFRGGGAPAKTLILLEAGDVVLPLRIPGLRSSEEIPLEFYGEVALRFNQDGAQGFLENLFKERTQLTFEELSGQLIGEVTQAVKFFCNASTVENLIKDPDLRIRLEDELNRVLGSTLDRFGLTLVRVPAAEFTGKEYEEHRRQMGEFELKRREKEFDLRMRELMAKNKMGQFKSEHDLDEYVAQLAQEKGISDLERNHEVNLLKQQFQTELRAHERVGEVHEKDHELNLDRKAQEHRRANSILDIETEVKTRSVRYDQEMDEARKALEIRKMKHDVEAERLERLAVIYSNTNTEAMLAMVDDPEKRRDLIDFVRMKQQEGRSEREILALAAERSDAAADALAQMSGVDKKEFHTLVEEQKRMYEGAAERSERMVEKAMDAASKNSGTNTQIIK